MLHLVQGLRWETDNHFHFRERERESLVAVRYMKLWNTNVYDIPACTVPAYLCIYLTENKWSVVTLFEMQNWEPVGASVTNMETRLSTICWSVCVKNDITHIVLYYYYYYILYLNFSFNNSLFCRREKINLIIIMYTSPFHKEHLHVSCYGVWVFSPTQWK